jgi:hypothetical protein
MSIDISENDLDFYFSKLNFGSNFFTRYRKILLVALFIIVFLPISFWFRYSFKTTSFLANKRGPEIGGRLHPQWSVASRYLKENIQSGDIIISSVPLAALYYFGNIDYRLNNGAFHNIVEGKTYRDPSTNIPAITNLNSLKHIIMENSRGWLLLDTNKMRNPNDIPHDVSEYIIKNMEQHNKKKEDTVYIFSWNNRQDS